MDDEKKDYGDLKTICTFSIKVKNKMKIEQLSEDRKQTKSKIIDSIIEDYGNN